MKYFFLFLSLLSFQCFAENNPLINHVIKQPSYHGVKCSIDASYPTLPEKTYKNAATFNNTILNFVMPLIHQFNQQCPAHIPAPGMNYHLAISYTVENTQNNIIAIRFSTYNCPGCNHSDTIFKTFNYDMNHGKMLKLSDVFKKNSPYLEEISAYCRKILNKQFPPASRPYPNIILDHTIPTEKNFEHWNLSPKGLVIAFNSQQIAAFGQSSEGTLVIIPFDQLRDYNLIRPSATFSD